MKLITMMTLFLSFTLHAQTYVDIEPRYPLDCEKANHDSVNRVEDIATYENDEIIEVYFDTYHFSCFNQQVSHKSVFQPYLVVWKPGMTMPWHYVPEAEVSQDGDKLAKVKIVFNKKKIFKKSYNRKYSYEFFPYAQSDFRYPWDIYLTYFPDVDKTEIIIK